MPFTEGLRFNQNHIMATNKNAVIRYRILDKCFKNFGRTYTIKDLLEEVNNELAYYNADGSGIQIRQLRVDIAFMKSDSGYSAPIKVFRDCGTPLQTQY